MRRFPVSLIFLAIALSAAGAELPPAKIEGVERLVTSFMSANEVPGMSIAIVADGELKWSNGYGFAYIENFVPAKSTTMYQNASIGKLQTATAAMRLEEEGKLDLEAD